MPCHGSLSPHRLHGCMSIARILPQVLCLYFYSTWRPCLSVSIMTSQNMSCLLMLEFFLLIKLDIKKKKEFCIIIRMPTELPCFFLPCVEKKSDLLLPKHKRHHWCQAWVWDKCAQRLVLSEPRQACQVSEKKTVKLKWGYGIHTNHCIMPNSGIFFHLSGLLWFLGDLLSSLYLLLNDSEN